MLFLIRARRFLVCLFAWTLIATSFQIAIAQTEDPTDGETDPIKLFERGQNVHAKGEVERALLFYEAAIKLRPEFPEAEYQRGIALVTLNRLPEAEKAFGRAIELRKDWALPYSALGNLLTRLSRDQEAEPLLRRAVQLGAKDFATLDSLSTVRFQAGNKEAALTLARQATEDENAPASAWTWRAAAERAMANNDAALNSLNHALQLQPDYVPALKERSELRAASADYEHAIEDLKKALAIKSGDKELSLQLARVYRLAGNNEEAQSIYQSLGITDASAPIKGRSPAQMVLIDADPADIDAANGDDTTKARVALEKLLIRNSRNAILWARLGEVTRRSDPAKSAEAYRKANEIDPKNPKYATGYAAALVQLRRFAEAESVLRRVIAAFPDEYTAHANLALSLYEMKRFTEAVPEYEWLAAKRPEIAATYFFLATAHDNLGEYEQALDAYQMFLSHANQTNNKLEIEKTNLRLPTLRDQIKRGQGTKRKRP